MLRGGRVLNLGVFWTGTSSQGGRALVGVGGGQSRGPFLLVLCDLGPVP